MMPVPATATAGSTSALSQVVGMSTRLPRNPVYLLWRHDYYLLDQQRLGNLATTWAGLGHLVAVSRHQLPVGVLFAKDKTTAIAAKPCPVSARRTGAVCKRVLQLCQAVADAHVFSPLSPNNSA